MSYEAVHSLLDELKLYGIDQTIDARVEAWSKQQTDLMTFVHQLLEEEKQHRQLKAVKSRTQYAGFPFPKTLHEYDFDFQPSIDKKQIQHLSSLKFLYNNENIILLGPPGVGKTHLSVGLGMRAAEEGKKPYFITAINLVDKLKSAFLNSRLDTTMNFFRRVDLLIVDELGYLPLDMEGAKFFFELVSSRYEKGSMIVTSNRSFSDWDKVFSDSVIAAAILDRLLHHSHIINIRGKSYRLREKQKGGLWDGVSDIPPHKNVGVSH